MTIQEVIEELMKVPESKRNLPLYVCDLETSDNFEIRAITLYDYGEEHTNTNMLACDFIEMDSQKIKSTEKSSN